MPNLRLCRKRYRKSRVGWEHHAQLGIIAHPLCCNLEQKTQMIAIPTNLADLLIIEPRIFGDERGFFFESFNRRRFAELTGRDADFVQDNHSRSARNVLRGLH